MLFHVKQARVLTEAILFADAKITKDHIEDILDIDPAEQPAQATGCHSKILGGEFLALRNDVHAAL